MKRYSFLLIATLLFFISCDDRGESSSEEVSNHIVASVEGDFTLTFSQLHNFYNDHEFGSRYPDSELRGYQEAMEFLITNHLKKVDFWETGMYRNPDYAEEIARLINEELEQAYFEEKHLSEYTSEQAINEYYEGIRKELHFRQIRIPKSASANQDALIEEIVEAHSQGVNFSRLLEQYSTSAGDAATSTLRGDRDRNSSLFKQLYALDEDDLKVVETSADILVIKIDRIEPLDAPPLPEIRDEIVQNLRQIHMREATEAFDEEKQNIIDTERINWRTSALNRLTALSQEADASFYDGNYARILQQEISRSGNQELLSYPAGEQEQRRSITYQDYIRLLDEVMVPNSTQGLSVAQHKEFMMEALQRFHILEKARDMGLDENILSISRISSELQGNILSLYNRIKIVEHIPEPTPERLRAFYDTHRDSIFAEPARARIFVLEFDQQEAAQQAWARYNSGTSFENLTSGYAVRSFTKNDAGEIRSYMSRELPYLGEVAFSMQEGDVEGPIAYQHAEKGQRYAIVKSHSNRTAHTPSFSDLQQSYLERSFQSYHERVLARRVKKEIWEKYPVSIYEKHLSEQIAAL